METNDKLRGLSFDFIGYVVESHFNIDKVTF
ncbi:MAG: hypothetical protein ACJAS1_005773 [Oleiphilaceae bacterium]|jgi:hypothetical protein